MRIKKWLLKNKQWVGRAYASVFVLGHVLTAMFALVWIGALGALIRELPPLNTLPCAIPTYILLGIGLIALVLCVIGFVIVCCVLTDNWWQWVRKTVRRRAKLRVWDLEYDVREAEQKAYAIELKNREKLTELKNATWEV